MLTLYGHEMSRARRIIWTLRELDVPYDHVPTDFLHGGNRTAEFLALNPNGKVPVLVDDGLVLFESLAINLYLARKFGTLIAPQTQAEDGQVTQWTLWVVNEVEKTLFVACENLFFFPPAERRPAEADLALAKLERPFRVLDGHLARHPFLVGDRFTVADINAAVVMSLIRIAGVDVSAYPNLERWLDTCLERPAADLWKRVAFSVPRPPSEAAWMQSLM